MIFFILAEINLPELDKWDENFLKKCYLTTVFDMLDAANAYNIGGLTRIICIYICHLLKIDKNKVLGYFTKGNSADL